MSSICFWHRVCRRHGEKEISNTSAYRELNEGRTDGELRIIAPHLLFSFSIRSYWNKVTIFVFLAQEYMLFGKGGHTLFTDRRIFNCKLIGTEPVFFRTS